MGKPIACFLLDLEAPCTNVSQPIPSSRLPGPVLPPHHQISLPEPRSGLPPPSLLTLTQHCLLYSKNTRCNFYFPICFNFQGSSADFFLCCKPHFISVSILSILYSAYINSGSRFVFLTKKFPQNASSLFDHCITLWKFSRVLGS